MPLFQPIGFGVTLDESRSEFPHCRFLLDLLGSIRLAVHQQDALARLRPTLRRALGRGRGFSALAKHAAV